MNESKGLETLPRNTAGETPQSVEATREIGAVAVKEAPTAPAEKKEIVEDPEAQELRELREYYEEMGLNVDPRLFEHPVSGVALREFMERNGEEAITPNEIEDFKREFLSTEITAEDLAKFTWSAGSPSMGGGGGGDLAYVRVRVRPSFERPLAFTNDDGNVVLATIAAEEKASGYNFHGYGPEHYRGRTFTEKDASIIPKIKYDKEVEYSLSSDGSILQCRHGRGGYFEWNPPFKRNASSTSELEY